MAYNTIIQSVEEGGLRLMDIGTRIKVNRLSWIRRIILAEESSVAETLRHLTNKKDITIILGSKCHFLKNIQERSPFYGQMLHTWDEYHNSLPQGEEEIRREVIWHNSRIEIEDIGMESKQISWKICQ